MGTQGGGVRSPRRAFRPELERETAAACETIAAEILDPVRIKSELLKAAQNGFQACFIQTDRPVDLRSSSAAKSLLAWLAGENLDAEWMRRTDPKRVHAATPDFWDLIISWHHAKDK